MTRQKDDMPTLLQTLQIEMGETARKMGELAALPARSRDHDSRLDSLTKDLKIMQLRMDSFAASQVAAGNTASPALIGAPGLAAGDAGTDGPTMELGIRLLEQGQYPSARTLFERLERIQPNDARVWYFGALAVGLASGDWDDQARDMVEKGLERERAGTPPTAEIDAAFGTRIPIKGQSWLDSVRKKSLNASQTP
jgi:Flp pilus assembly protein TadD